MTNWCHLCWDCVTYYALGEGHKSSQADAGKYKLFFCFPR